MTDFTYGDKQVAAGDPSGHVESSSCDCGECWAEGVGKFSGQGAPEPFFRGAE